MKRLACRLLLIGLSVSVLAAAVFAALGQTRIALLKSPTPLGFAVTRIDAQGWLFQFGPIPQPKAGITTQPYNASNDQDWHASLQDVSATWMTPGIVYAKWQPAGISYTLIGVGHKTVLFALSVATVAITVWYRRRWPRGNDPE